MSIIKCPNCQSLLLKNDRVLTCQNGHSFDIAKGGYINLLLPNKKKNLNPGDNKLMMTAREAFLTTGHYDSLIEAIDISVTSTEVFSNSLSKNFNLLDLGCGTGYYTRKLLDGHSINKIGIDLSKAGISKASKKDKLSTYIVSSIFDLPIIKDSVDLAINIFSPVSIDEVKRVLKPGGYFYKVVPDESHMNEVASLIYDSIIPHQSSIEADLDAHPELHVVKIHHLEKQIEVSDETLYNLVAMTPYLYKFEEGALDKLKSLTVTISFKIIIIKNG